MNYGLRQDENQVNYRLVEVETWNREIDSFGRPKTTLKRENLLPSVASPSACMVPSETEEIQFLTSI